MTDTRARDALAAALREGDRRHHDPEHGRWTFDPGEDPIYDTLLIEEVDRILDYPFTPAERRALAAAFLDAETLAVAVGYHNLHETRGDQHCGNYCAAAILAALRETPVRMIPESDATHGYTCGTCPWGRDGGQNRTYWDYLDHRVETGHDPVVSGPALRETT